uniref:ETFB lysine methyltransferase n=1 Tax=Phaeomonas parva TaxID=124430 RepID=A0A6U4DST5_9STRA|mmetsp:Transcript_18033/g.55282  ORF Transcript_18033/g.55282 Transcript_18033/m.55282 type:complete len:189 (+) Transcript_18033:454-1020(+)
MGELQDSGELGRGARVLDMGCGSGILSVAALALGAGSATCVDVEAEALLTTQRNMELNFGDDADDRVELLHARQVVPCGLEPQDVAFANILVGQLIRPSMVAVLATNLQPGGILCLSGIRPGDQCDTVRKAYAEWFEFDDDLYREADATAETGGKEYWGRWGRLVGRRIKEKGLTSELIENLSDAAVS